MVVIHVVDWNGSPVHYAEVTIIWSDFPANTHSTEHTDYDGNAYFDGSGTGTVYVDGREVCSEYLDGSYTFTS